MNVPYHPYYCEENAYRICELFTGTAADDTPHRDLERFSVPSDDAALLFVFSDAPWVAMHNQRATRHGTPIYWDYHVVATVNIADTWRAYDPDSRIPPGVGLDTYLAETFPESPIFEKNERERSPEPRYGETPAAFAEPQDRSSARPDRPGTRGAQPLFRWVPWSVARTTFGSDRRHMRNPEGGWTRPVPPWPPINPEHHTLPDFLSPDENGIGRVYTLPDLVTDLYRGD
ncbi:MAG: hypothetical protein ACLFSV_09735 [Alkalispirochaeta sp.]